MLSASSSPSPCLRIGNAAWTLSETSGKTLQVPPTHALTQLAGEDRRRCLVRQFGDVAGADGTSQVTLDAMACSTGAIRSKTR
jgi:hypothetical protein